MRVSSGEWNVASESTDIEVEPGHAISVRVSCTKTVQLLGVRGSTEIPIKCAPEFRWRGRIEGFDLLRIKGEKAVPYGFQVVDMPSPRAERLNHDDPPAIPPPDASANLLLQIRKAMSAQAAMARLPVMEPDQLDPWRDRYVVEDDDFRFEEQIGAEELQKREERKKKATEAKAAAAQKAKAEAATESVTEPPPPQKPETPPKPAKAPPPAAQAAE